MKDSVCRKRTAEFSVKAITATYSSGPAGSGLKQFNWRWMPVVLMLALIAAFLIQFPARVFAGPAQDVQAGMQLLKSKAAALGVPSVKGEEAVAGKMVPVIYFGTTKMNNNFTLVDEVQKEKGGTATIFVKSGDGFVRVATNVKKADGSRAIGTILDPKGKVIVAIEKGESYFGEANILGKEYVTGYEPIRDASNNIIGIYYVGYLKK
jgi:Cache 3/Cache 2 fusion domain